MDRYVAGLYWSVMTLTSIGYGDFVPQNTTERWLCSFYMLLSGVLWTYVIGSVAAIATTLNPNRILYENTMDQSVPHRTPLFSFLASNPSMPSSLWPSFASRCSLFLLLICVRFYGAPRCRLNYFMRERQLPRTMRIQLREFLKNARRVNQLNDDGDLLSKLSPQLQGTVALAANKKWIGQIWFFREMWSSREGIGFVAALARHLVLRNFTAQERLPVGQLYIVRKGLLVKMWRFLGSGKVWGEDIILPSEELMDHAQAVALSYVEVYTLRRHALFTLLEDHPVASAVVHKAGRRILFQRAILKYLAQQAGKPGPCSFIMKSMSTEPEVVDDNLTLEQKLDVTMTAVEGLQKKVNEELVGEVLAIKSMLQILVDKSR
jgi:CRP-like cAMP-binding protein